MNCVYDFKTNTLLAGTPSPALVAASYSDEAGLTGAWCAIKDNQDVWHPVDKNTPGSTVVYVYDTEQTPY